MLIIFLIHSLKQILKMTTPLFTNDAIVFGIIMISLGFVFYTESKTNGFWHKFYKIVPGLLMCYTIPALFNSFGIINADTSKTYYIASRYLLPASLVLMTLSINLKAIFNLGPKALILFFYRNFRNYYWWPFSNSTNCLDFP